MYDSFPRSTSQRWMLALGLALCLAGCGESVEPVSDGHLTVSWEISPRGCDEAGVEKVRASLSYEGGTRTEAFVCGRGEGTVENLRPANYKLRLVGIDEKGQSTFEAGPRKVTVHGGGQTDGPHLRLTASPANLSIVWRFNNGMVCGANEVSNVEVAIFDTDDYKVLERSFECTRGRATIEEIPPGEYLVEVRASGDDQRFMGGHAVDAERGVASEVEVVLEGRSEGRSRGR